MFIKKNLENLISAAEELLEKSPEKCLEKIAEALEYANITQNNNDLAEYSQRIAILFLNLGSLYFNEGQNEEFTAMIEKADTSAKAIIFEAIAKLYKEKKNFKKAFEFNNKYFEIREKILKEKIKKSQRNISSENISELKKNYKMKYPEIIGESAEITDILDTLELISNHNINIFLSGPSGCGKGLFAKTIHRKFSKKSPFVTIDCSSIPENLLESELFGYKKGAFTDAVNDKKGKIEEADNGVLFLDEVGDMPMKLQTKILRLIQEKTFYPIGSSHPKSVSIRIISATNKDPEKMIKDGVFREDLFFRLNVLRIHIPPLNKHKSDIPLLVRHFIDKFNNKFNKKIVNCDSKALKILSDFDWPGDVRELQNSIERAVLLCKEDTLKPELFYDLITEIPVDWKEFQIMKAGKIKKAESDYIKHLLSKFNNNVSKASEFAGLRRTQIYRLLRKKVASE